MRSLAVGQAAFEISSSAIVALRDRHCNQERVHARGNGIVHIGSGSYKACRGVGIALSAAKISGESPALDVTFGLAPAFSRTSTASACPSAAAHISAF